MKKAGARPGQLVRSASRRGKAASRFQFDVTVDRLFGALVKPGNTYYVKWSRGVKVAQTKPVLAARDHVGGNKAAGGLPFHDKISLLVTLYRTDSKFDEKDSKFAVISVNAKGQERTVAKAHFDLSQYAGVPSASAEKVFKLSEKASVRVTIDSRFMKAGAKGPGSAGASSAMSGMTAASGVSSDLDEDDEEFGDLDVNDVPEPEEPVGNGRSRRGSSASTSSAASTKTPLSPGKNNKRSVPAGGSRHSEEPPPRAMASSARSFGRQASGGGSGDGDAKLRAELAAAKDELETVGIDLRRAQDKRKRLEAAHEAELASLRAKLAAAPSAGGSGPAGVERDLEKERRRVEELTGKLEGVNRDFAAVRSERDTLKGEVVPLRATAHEVDKLRKSNQEMNRELDAMAAGAGGGDVDTVAKARMAKLQEEKQKLEQNVRAHQKHSSSVKETYQKLTGMYNTLREENIDLQGKLESMGEELKEAESGRKDAERKALEASSAASDAASRAAEAARRESLGASGSSASREERLEAAETQLAVSQREVADIKASKQALQRDYDNMKAQNDTLQGRVDKAVAEKDKARKEGDSLAAELAEANVQKDAAVARAEKADGSRGSTSSADAAKLSAATKAREEGEREILHLKQRVSEIEREMEDKAEDLEYERSEKTKAREERDALRESARALERRTSQVSQTADAVHSLKRQLSTHKMRESDQAAMIRDLRDEVKQLQAEVDGARSGGGGGAHSGGDESAVLEDLVVTKLALAEAEDQKLRLEFELKNQKKSERGVQEKLAAHASRLEVQLGEANDELAKARAKLISEEDASLL